MPAFWVLLSLILTKSDPQDIAQDYLLNDILDYHFSVKESLMVPSTLHSGSYSS